MDEGDEPDDHEMSSIPSNDSNMMDTDELGRNFSRQCSVAARKGVHSAGPSSMTTSPLPTSKNGKERLPMSGTRRVSMKRARAKYSTWTSADMMRAKVKCAGEHAQRH